MLIFSYLEQSAGADGFPGGQYQQYVPYMGMGYYPPGVVSPVGGVQYYDPAAYAQMSSTSCCCLSFFSLELSGALSLSFSPPPRRACAPAYREQ